MLQAKTPSPKPKSKPKLQATTLESTFMVSLALGHAGLIGLMAWHPGLLRLCGSAVSGCIPISHEELHKELHEFLTLMACRQPEG